MENKINIAELKDCPPAITQLEPPLKVNLEFDELDNDYTADDINFKIIK